MALLLESNSGLIRRMPAVPYLDFNRAKIKL